MGVSFATAIRFTRARAQVQTLNRLPVVTLYVCEVQSPAPVATTSSLELGINYKINNNLYVILWAYNILAIMYFYENMGWYT